jgi:hypothetical protein
VKDIVANEFWCIMSLVRSVWRTTGSVSDVCTQKQGMQNKLLRVQLKRIMKDCQDRKESVSIRWISLDSGDPLLK